MRQIGLHLLSTWRRMARFHCLFVAVFLGLLTACLVAALWVLLMTPTPSAQTRIRLEADMPACSLDASELPSGLLSLGGHPYLPYGKVLPSRALAGIRMDFLRRGSNAAVSAFHDILLYRTTFQAAFAFDQVKFRRNSKWYPTWLPLDISQANLSADEYRAACADFVPDGRGPFAPGGGLGRGDKTCQSKARYGRFLSLFNTFVLPREMSEEEMIQILKAIDKHMLTCVDSYADREWD